MKNNKHYNYSPKNLGKAVNTYAGKSTALVKRQEEELRRLKEEYAEAHKTVFGEYPSYKQ